MVTKSSIKTLSDLKDVDVSQVGGKVYSLAILIKNGFNVPHGVVITSKAFFNFLETNDLLKRIQKLTSEINEFNSSEKSEEIRNLILSGEILEDMAIKLNNSLIKLSVDYLSIRSSAVSEDSLKASFAGLHDTFLKIKPELPTVLEVIKKCWASLYNERAVVYRIKNKIPHLDGMAILIQEMIKSDISGIIFTEHPFIKGIILIEASRGLGDRMAAGEITPDSYTIERKTLKIKDKQIIGGDSILLEKDIITLAAMALKIEHVFGYPQDIEFAVANGINFVLQSRPITR